MEIEQFVRLIVERLPFDAEEMVDHDTIAASLQKHLAAMARLQTIDCNAQDMAAVSIKLFQACIEYTASRHPNAFLPELVRGELATILRHSAVRYNDQRSK